MLLALVWVLVAGPIAGAQERPVLTGPVNDFAGVVDAPSADALESLITSLQRASGDTVVVVTVRSFEPLASIRELASELFDNQGRGIGPHGGGDGLLILLAVDNLEVWVQVGDDLAALVTADFAGATSREAMAPEFSRGNYGAGLLAGASLLIGRIADGRNVALQGLPTAQRRSLAPNPESGGSILLALLVVFALLNVVAARIRSGDRRGRDRWGRGWSGWNGGVGPFGNGRFGGGFGGFSSIRGADQGGLQP